MSRKFAERNYHCISDCIQTGCPGHLAKLTYENTSDTVVLEVFTNKERVRTEIFDRFEWRVFINLEKEIND